MEGLALASDLDFVLGIVLQATTCWFRNTYSNVTSHHSVVLSDFFFLSIVSILNF
jgi:hypothetical protein